MTYESLLLMDDSDLVTLGFKLGNRKLLLRWIASQKPGKSDILMNLRCVLVLRIDMNVCVSIAI